MLIPTSVCAGGIYIIGSAGGYLKINYQSSLMETVLMFIMSYTYYITLYNIIEKTYYRVTIQLSRIFHLVCDSLKRFDTAILIFAMIIKSERIYNAETTSMRSIRLLAIVESVSELAIYYKQISVFPNCRQRYTVQ